MMKNRMKPILLSLILAFTLLALPAIAWGDFGDYGGTTDYGGGGTDWGGGTTTTDWGTTDDYDYNTGNTYFISDDNSPSDDGSVWPIAIVIFLGAMAVLLVYGYFKNKASGGTKTITGGGGTLTDASTLKSIDELKTSDPNFSEQAIQQKISNLYVQMQNTWTAKDISSLQPYFTDEFYKQMDRQLDSYRTGKKTDHVENIAVLGITLSGWYENEGNECLVAIVNTRIIDYTTDDNTGEIITGSRTAEKFMEYEYTLVRTKGSKTATQTEETKAINCPNCGAALDINNSTKCPYCGSVIHAKDFDWVISLIKGISQRTAG